MAQSNDTPANPFELALSAQDGMLNTQRELLDSVNQATRTFSIAPDRLEQIASVEVGQTPSEVVYTENKLELLHYESQTETCEVPILIVYALINKPFILDLQPDRSVVRRLLEAGHDVYLIDWNEPSRLDRHLTLDDYVNRYIENCVDVVRERSDQESINMLGYCMGGTMSAMYAALHPEKLNALSLMAAGLCFDDTGGVLEQWGDGEYYDPESVTEAFGNMPAEMLSVGFALMDPVANYISKYVRLYENLADEEFVKNFARMEHWLSEGIDIAGETYVQFLKDVYQDNKLYENELTLNGTHVDITAIDMPVLQVIGEYDHLIPADASKSFNDVIGSDDTSVIEHPTGHIGLSVSGSSHEHVWPDVSDWFHEKSDAAPGEQAKTSDDNSPTVDGERANAEAESNKQSVVDEDGVSSNGIETIDGIGPTYANRLREGGIETIADLTAADGETVADLAEVSLSRAESWIDQGR